MADVIPRGTQWLKDRVISIKADENTVITSKGDIISYKIMIVAMGLQLYWDKVLNYINYINKKHWSKIELIKINCIKFNPILD